MRLNSLLRATAPLAALVALGASGNGRPTPGAAPNADRAALIAPLFEPDQGDTRAVLLIEGGRVTAKRYASGYSDANRFISWSMAKTITGMLVGALVHDGRLKLDDPAPVAEWHGAGDPRAAITLRNLLNMSSGLRHVEVGDPVEASDTNQVLFVSGTQAMAARAIGQPLEAKPGTTFKYSSLTTIILAEIVTRALTDSRDPRVRAAAYTAFAQDRVFKPAGITSARLEFDGSGTQIGGSLIYMTLDDWGRMGTVLLDGGKVIAPDWLAFMKTASPTNPVYGGQTWLNRPAPAGNDDVMFPGKAPPTMAAFRGHLGQLIFASPQGAHGRGAVLVRLGNTVESNRQVMGRLGDVMAAVDR